MNRPLSPEERILASGGTIERVTPEPGLRFGRLRVLTLADLSRLPPRRWLLRNLLAEGDLALIYGPPKSGKSFLTTRLLWGASLGIGFGNHDATRPVRVLYCAAEGESGFPLRLAALRDALGDPDDGFRFIVQRLTLGDPSDDLDPLARAVRETRSEVIAVDTVSRTFGRGDENAARDMAAYIEALDKLREHARWPGGPAIACVLVHHGAKHAPGSRGSTVLPAAADVIVRCERLGGGNMATIEAAKDAPDGLTIPFRLARVDLPPTPEGEPQSTCIAEPSEATAAPQRDLPPKARQALDLLYDLIVREGEPLPTEWGIPQGMRGVPLDRWREWCRERGLADAPAAFRMAWKRAFDSLTATNRVACRDHRGVMFAWAVREGGRA